MAGLNEGNRRMTADITGAASQQNIHGISFRIMGLHSEFVLRLLETSDYKSSKVRTREIAVCN